MLSARDYVEIMTLNRLSKLDRKVSDDEFNRVVQKIGGLIHKFSLVDVNRVAGFDPEDIEGFFLLKTYQILSFDRKYVNEFSYFAKSFQNLVRNLKRDMETSKKHLEYDVYCGEITVCSIESVEKYICK